MQHELWVMLRHYPFHGAPPRVLMETRQQWDDQTPADQIPMPGFRELLQEFTKHAQRRSVEANFPSGGVIEVYIGWWGPRTVAFAIPHELLKFAGWRRWEISIDVNTER